MKITTLLLFFSLVLPSQTIAQANKPALQNDLVLKYLIKEPATKSTHPPVIILLHGVGSNEEDLFSLADALPKEALIISARAPITLSEKGYGWYHINYANGTPSTDPAEAETSRVLISQFIDQVIKKYHPNNSKVILIGFSQGAIMSYSMALTDTGKICGIAALSGRMLDEPKKKFDLHQLRKISVFIAHGTQDKVLPIQHAKEAHTWFDRFKLPNTYHEYRMGHEISTPELNDVIAWLTNQFRKYDD